MVDSQGLAPGCDAFLKGQWGSLPATSVNPQAEGKDLHKLSIGCGAAHQAGSPTSGPRRAPISTQWGPLGLEALARDLGEPGWRGRQPRETIWAQEDWEGQRIVRTTESSRACQRCLVPGPHTA